MAAERGPLVLFTPSGVVPRAAALHLAVRRLRERGYDVEVDPAATARHQRFGGRDEVRLLALHRVADAAPGIALHPVSAPPVAR